MLRMKMAYVTMPSSIARRECHLDEPSITADKVEQLLAELRAGNLEARPELINAACERLLLLTRKIKRSFPQVGRWEQTEDVFQNASIRLYNALTDVEIRDALHFFRLAALQIRRELIDMARRYDGPYGINRNHHSDPDRPDDELAVGRVEAVDTTYNPRAIAQWAEFHEAIDELPDKEREVTELIWYHGMHQQEAAQLMGVDERSVRRYWRNARLALHRKLQGELPSI